MPRTRPDNTDRDRAICAKHTLGQTTESLAAEYGVSRQRISQILKAQAPRAPGEGERAEIAGTLRAKYLELQRIVTEGTPRSSAIGKVVLWPEGTERAGQVVNDDSVRIRAIAEQAKLMTQYRQMFGVDISQAPAPLVDARMQIQVNQINMARQVEGLAPLRQLGAAPHEVSLKQAEAERQASPLYATGGGIVIPAAVVAGGPEAIHAYVSNQQYKAQHAVTAAAEVIDD